ncbi:MAG: protein kinase domain-containing protein [Myxococcota bacterium]
MGSEDTRRVESVVERVKASSSATPADADFVPPFEDGEVLLGKYRIDRLIGTGGIGYVMSATNVGLDEQVALKFLRPEFLKNEEAVYRFTNEARLAAKIQHPNVARVLDIASAEGAGPFIVMELLVGRDLNQILHEEGRLSVERAVAYVLEACEALSAAHARDIVHRDVKPDNLFLARQQKGPDVIKILDFGISKLQLSSSGKGRNPALFQTMTALGSPSYMAPEQIRASPDIDARADVWSLGCVLYELLTAKHAFDAPTLMQVCAVVLEREPTSLRTHAPDVPAELEAIVARCLQKSPDARFANVEELARALRPFASGAARDVVPLVEIKDISDAEDERLPPPPRVPATQEARERDGASPQSTAPVALDADAQRLAARASQRPRAAAGGRVQLREALAYAALAACVGVSAATLMAAREHAQHARSSAARSQAAEAQAARVVNQPRPASASAAAPAPAPITPEKAPTSSAASASKAPSTHVRALAPRPNTPLPREPELEPEAGPELEVSSSPLTDSQSHADTQSASSNVESAAHAAFMQQANDGANTAPSEPALDNEPTPLQPGPASGANSELDPVRTATPAASKADAANKLSASVVNAVVRTHSAEIQKCFEEARVDYRNSRGRVALFATLDREGNVVAARLSAPFTEAPRVPHCLVSAAKRWKFPARGGAPGLSSYRVVLE